jgi:ATP-dependent RNA helicase DHX57
LWGKRSVSNFWCQRTCCSVVRGWLNLEGVRREAGGGRREKGGGREEEGRRKEEGGRRKEEGGRRKEEGGRRKEEGGRRKEEGGTVEETRTNSLEIQETIFHQISPQAVQHFLRLVQIDRRVYPNHSFAQTTRDVLQRIKRGRRGHSLVRGLMTEHTDTNQ